MHSLISSAGDGVVHLVGVGNPIRQDDGVGLEIVSKLRRSLGPVPRAGLRIHAPTLNPERVISKVASRGERLVLFDAVEAGKKPGSIVCACLGETKFGFFATHNIPLRLIPEVKDNLESIYVVGIQPESVDVGEGLSEPVRRASEDLVASIVAMGGAGG